MKNIMNKKTTSALASLILSVPATQGALTSNLVAYYDFEDLASAPGTGATDLVVTGTGNTVGLATGVAGSAAEFTGTTGNVLTASLGFGGGGANQLGDNFTVSAWYNLNTDAASGASRFFVFEGNTDYDISYGLRASGGEPGFNDTQTFTNAATGTDPSALHLDVHTPGTWQHVLMTYQSDEGTTTITTYIDLNEASVLSLPTAELSSGAINIGNARNTALNRAFDGRIDEFGAWNRVLTQEEIGQAYDLGLNGQALNIPEPSAALLCGLAGLGALIRRRS
jgi:hypothetical protein